MRSWVALAWVAAVLHGVVGDGSSLWIGFHATAGLWWIGGVAMIAAGGLARDRVSVVGALGATVVALAWTVPGTVGSVDEGSGNALRVGVVNVLSRNPEAAVAVGELAAEEPDVMAILEVPPSLESDLHGLAGWPVRDVRARTDNFGIAVFGPEGSSVEQRTMGGVPWRILQVPVGHRIIEVVAAHTLPPVVEDYRQSWLQQLEWLAERNRDGRTRVVIGDLNITRHNPRFRVLSGLNDAFARAGRAGVRTWTPLKLGPDLLRLDHVLVSDGVRVAEIRALPRRGSDHRGIVADLVVE